ncbi:hypothetical protein HELRODRAFT_158928 [Helobdella robusta]|uniref:Zinc finger PHD-type domain-containing protein n=1 Tax=Helobdella robusta TaxID=6412 RepID=T1ENF1_HELRO|nr:hypothetical protein HELRODRAFT_158928 [Helobdella robusta]ESO12407.1 hypothetical protein HELRODRAFT_158928 [Helobdella robusta]
MINSIKGRGKVKSKKKIMTNENCCKCDSVVEDGICCPCCQSFVHPKCAGFTKDSLSLYKKMKNLRWYCDNCLSYVDDVKGISKLINDKHVALNMELKKISESGDILRNDIEQLRIAVDNSKGKLDQVASVDSLKSEINAKWSEVVKKNCDAVCSEVRSIQKTLNVVNENKERENNIIIFNLAESENSVKDKEIVMKIFQSLTEESIKSSDVVKVFRQGKKEEQITSPRPIIVKFNNTSSKVLVMNKLFKIKLLDDKLKSIRISHDMTREQRTDYRKLVDEAKSREADDGEDFLYRVRGPVGRWKIVRFLKKGK